MRESTLAAIVIVVVFFFGGVANALEFMAFGDVSFSESTETGAKNAFALGQLDLYATQQINENTRGFIELIVEHDGEGFVVDLERLWLRRTFSDLLEVTAGRQHTPLGYWNGHYHHGSLVQDTVSRPSFLEFEDGNSAILPVHIIGVSATGKKRINRTTFGYKLYVANGPSINSEAGFNPAPDTKPEIDINNVSDSNNDKTVGLRVTIAPNAYPLQVGVFGMRNTVAESGDLMVVGAKKGEDLVSQNIIGFDLKFTGEKLDVMGEYYNLDNKNKVGSSGSHTGTAYYAQLGYQLTEQIKPVYRYESVDFDTSDSYFRLLGTREEVHHVMGLRYDIDESNAIKLEANFTNPSKVSNFKTYTLQWTWIMP